MEARLVRMDGGAAAATRQLKVGGVTPFSATDYPGQLSAVVFVQGCPWRCGYCHNPHLQARPANSPLPWQHVMALLERRVGLIDAVVFSGGEPTIDPALAGAMRQARALGFKVGLHTACIYPERLAEVLPLIDWVGFDIKAPFAQYAGITGAPDSGEQAQACARLIVDSGVDYECRTTIHPTLLQPRDIVALAGTLAGMGVTNYVLQEFRPQGCNDAALKTQAQPGYPGQEVVAQVEALFPRFTLRRPH